MADLTKQELSSKEQHFEEQAHAGKSINCEFDSLPHGQQLQMVRDIEQKRSSDPTFVPDLNFVGDENGLHLRSKTNPNDTVCAPDQGQTGPGEQIAQKHAVPDAGGQPKWLKQEMAEARQRKLADDATDQKYKNDHPEVEGAHLFDLFKQAGESANTLDLAKIKSPEFKKENDAEGQLRQEMDNLMHGDPAYRDKVLQWLEFQKDAKVTRGDDGTPTQVHFQRFYGMFDNVDKNTGEINGGITIDLTKNLEQQAQAAKTRAQQTAQGPLPAIASAAVGGRELSAVPDDQKRWYEKADAYHDYKFVVRAPENQQ